MAALKRFSVYVLLFLLMMIVIVFTDLWRPLDYVFYRTFYLDKPDDIQLRDDIWLIDVPYQRADDRGNSTGLDDYRERIVDLLKVIVQQGAQHGYPDAVILDMYLSSDDRRGLDQLDEAIRKLSKEVRMYAVFNAEAANKKNFESLKSGHALELYEYLQGPFLHTLFEYKMGILSYRSEEVIDTEGGNKQFIEALPLRVARDENDKITVPSPPREYVLPLGSDSEINSQVYLFKHPAGMTTGGTFAKLDNPQIDSLEMDHMILLVGSLEEDKVDFLQQAGPKLVAWAIDDQRNLNKNARQPLNQPAVILGQILFFSILAVVIFALLFKYVKALQTKPLLISVVSFLVGAGVLAALSAALLSLGYVTQLGLTLIAMLLAVLLTWRFAMKFLVTGVAEGAGKYDVFISYSRQHGDWVIKNLYEPLMDLRDANGKKLSVFFDRAEIGVGEAFTSKYMWAIVDSRFFIPVFSKGYYDKNHCRNEMDLAYKRSVEQKIKILPVALSEDDVPQIYSHLNYLDAKVNKSFMSEIANTLFERNQ